MEGGVDTQKMLCTEVMKGNWEEVLKIYSKKLEKQELTIELLPVKITQSGDTTLHMAIYKDDPENLEKLIKLIERTSDQQREVSASAEAAAAEEEKEKEKEKERGKARDLLADDEGNTPLHLAAKMGRHLMCYAIANSTSTKLSGLLSCRNNEGETPIFVAALHGKTAAFRALCYVCLTKAKKDMRDYSEIQKYCSRTDGNTVLHCAIDGEYFGLAYQIIDRFPDFAHCAEKRGYFPLHILASKDSSFESSSGLTWWQKLIYKGLPAVKPPVLENFRPSNDDDAGKHRKPEGTDVENPPPSAQTKHSTDRYHFVSKSRRYINDLYKDHIIVTMKRKHSYALEIEKLLLKSASYYEYLGQSASSYESKEKKETPILMAAKSGIKEIVKDILDEFPAAIHDVNSEGKNLILLTAENRQPQMCEWLIKNCKENTKDLFLGLDKNGNSALHHAAMLKNYQPWLAPNAVLQMQWEIKWFEYIKKQMPKHLLGHKNNNGQIAEEIFLVEHSKLLKNDTEWLMKTAESCTIVATLIATVAFATSVSVPGGTESRGEPVLREEPMFEVFSISSLLALCFSLTAVVMFLAILTSRRQATDFGKSLPMKLLIGLTALFLSIASVLVSFCGGHFFVLKNVLKDAKVAEYAVVVITLLVFAIAQFPLYFKHILATFKKVPERGFMANRARVSQVQAQSQEGPSQPSPN